MRATLSVVLSSLLLFAASCSPAADPVLAEAAELFDAGERLVDLTPANGAEDVRRSEVVQAIAQADEAGTALRVVVAAPEGEFIAASSIVDQYGGTAISYQANRTGFEGASRDVSKAQLDRAVAAAKDELDIGDSATAFVKVIADEGVEPRGRSMASTLLWFLLALGALVMVSGAYSYWQARRRRKKRQVDFEARKAVLTDWAGQLRPEVESLRVPVAASADDSGQQTWHDSHDFIAKILPSLDQATGAEDLDAAEMRIGRTAIKLRDLRRSLDA